ncbi:hypothetical protein KR044_003056 [Drosophila immigrans]|nr:hypothetical protein KR044_003056 [Drosophila immigrans]
MFRVQKVLLAEYHEIYEPVMIESPFTLVDANGQGLSQYQVALTASKLLLGSDNFDKQEEQDEDYDFLNRGLDPEIECFDLISMVPLEYIRFNFYRKHDRCQMMLSVQHQELQLKAEHPMIFEFGGHIHKQYYWHTWRERVAMLRCYQPRYSHITGASPFSSSDVHIEEELHKAQIHVPYKPQSVYSLCFSSAGGA